MNELQRWSNPSSGSSLEERRVIEAAPDPSPPPGAQDAVWKAMVAAVGVAAGTGISALPSSPPPIGALESVSLKATTGVLLKPVVATVIKAFVLGSLGGGLVVGAVYHARPSAFSSPWNEASSSSRRAPSASPRATPPPREPRAAATPSQDQEQARDQADDQAQEAGDSAPSEMSTEPAPARPPPKQGKSAATAKPPSSLAEEAHLLHEARTRLGRGDLNGAKAILEAAQESFGTGALGQEREALAIELLWRSGEVEAAERRARTFLELNPNSPHAARVERALH